MRTEDRVLLALSDGQAFVAAWYAALKIGAAVAEAYTFLQVKDYAYYVDYMRARVVVVDQNTLAKVEEAVAGMRFPPRLLVVGGSFDELVAGAGRAEPAATRRTTWRSGSSQPAPPGRRRRLFTPRTTRWSRSSAMHSASSATRRTTSSCPSRSCSSATRDMTTLFSFGVGAAGIVFPERSTPERLFELIEQHRPTIMVNVPTTMAAMLEYPGAEDRDLLRPCASASLPVRPCRTRSPPLARGLRRRGSRRYRLVRAVPHLHLEPTGARPPRQYRRASTGWSDSSTGRGSRFPDGVPGELWASGRGAARSATGATTRSRSSRSTATQCGRATSSSATETGYYWYRGRADDLLKVAGIWIAPLELENCLLRHPGGGRVAVVGYEEQGLVLPRAFVVLRGATESDELATELQEFVRAELSPHKYPRDIRFVAGAAEEARLGEDRPAHAEGRRAPGDGGLDELGAMAYVVGIDIGGTCTDCVVVDEKGESVSRRSRLRRAGLLGEVADALGVAAVQLGLGVGELLSETHLFLHSTTVAENAVVDGTLASAGVITSRGFEDTLFAMRGGYGRWSGLTEEEKRNPIKTDEPAGEIVSRAHSSWASASERMRPARSRWPQTRSRSSRWSGGWSKRESRRSASARSGRSPITRRSS